MANANLRRVTRSVNIRHTVTYDENRARRTYRLKKRADAMAETRRRITEAAVELHGSVGPSRTTVSAVARRAGVERQTVYRHFPTNEELFVACSEHFLAANPLPDIDAWRAIDDPQTRLARALADLYAYYEHTAPMYANVVRDADLVEALRPPLTLLEDYLAEAARVIAAGWGTRGRRRDVLTAAARHAVDVATWRSLTASGLVTRGQAVGLVTALVRAASTPTPPASPAAVG
jgi:AcrR family transcriptional regulator